MPRGSAARRGRRVLLAASLTALFAAATPAAAQYRLSLPSGDSLQFSRDDVRGMLESTRAFRRELEEDPEVLYFTGVGPEVEPDSPVPAYPWHAVDVLSDSTAAIRTPGNLREADRAYAAYAVVRMGNVRRDPDLPCDSLMAREEAAVSAFVDGWVVSRVLFGGPPYPPLDEMAFARAAGRLAGMIAALEDPQLGGCLGVWSEEHPEQLRTYRRWRRGLPLDREGGAAGGR